MKKLNILFFAGLLVSLTSCLKDKNVNLGEGAPVSPPVIQWSTATIDDAPKNANTASFRLYSRIIPVGASVSMALQVDLTGSEAASSDITVGVAGSPAAYATFFPTAPAATPLLPAANYTMPASVTIPKGSRYATVNVTLNTATLDPTKVYYLPVAITSTSYGSVSGNYGTVIYALSPANRYDGLYTYTNAGTATIKAGVTVPNAPLINTIPAGTALSNANSVTTNLFQDPSYASTAIYNFSATLNASGYYPITSISLPGFFTPSAIDPLSGYYPATKTIRAKYTAGVFNLDETFTYTGPRTTTK